MSNRDIFITEADHEKLMQLLQGARQRQHIIPALLIGVARLNNIASVSIVWTLLVACPLAKHTAQPEENEHGKRQKNDGVDIEHVYSRGGGCRGCPGGSPAGPILGPPCLFQRYNVGTRLQP